MERDGSDERTAQSGEPGDVGELAGDMPTGKEDYDAWRAERFFAQTNSDDLRWMFMVKQAERKPEWKTFIDELGAQAGVMDNRTLLQAFNTWNEERVSSKPGWLNEEESGPSDLQDLNEKFPPDDRNDAMGPAPSGQFGVPRSVGNQGRS